MYIIPHPVYKVKTGLSVERYEATLCQFSFLCTANGRFHIRSWNECIHIKKILENLTTVILKLQIRDRRCMCASWTLCVRSATPA